MRRARIIIVMLVVLVLAIPLTTGALPRTVPWRVYQTAIASRNMYRDEVRRLECELVQDRMSDGQYISFLEGRIAELEGRQ